MSHAEALTNKNQRRSPKEERYARISQMTRLYINAGLTLQEIAVLYGVTRQAVSDRLTRAGVQMRTHRRPSVPPLEECQDEMVRLYLDERVPVYLLAQRFRVTNKEIRQLLLNRGIELRQKGRPRKFPELYDLKLNETIILPKPTGNGKCRHNWHETFYSAARRLGVRFSVKSIDDRTIRVTRVK